MKLTLFALGAIILIATTVHVLARLPQEESTTGESSLFQHLPGHAQPRSQSEQSEAPVTLSFGETDDHNLCNDEFWIGVYNNMKDVYTIGIENVTVELLEQETFAYFRGLPGLSEEESEAWIEHIRDIPAQFVEIIREDPAVLDSCANFSVAAVGPP